MSEAAAGADVTNDACILEADDLLAEFGWQANLGASALEERLLQELTVLEKDTVRSIIDADSQIKSVLGELDNGAGHLDALDGWLRGYNYELTSMEKDIMEIQAQNELLKVEERNQTRLLEELEYLMYSITITEEELSTLREESLESSHGLYNIERAAGRLQRMLESNLDPKLKAMRATQEKMEKYTYYSGNFAARATEYLKVMFRFSIESVAADSSKGKGKLAPSPGIIVKPTGPAYVHKSLVKFRALVLWLKQMATDKHKELRNIYISTMGNLYNSQIQDLVGSVKPLMVRGKASTDDLDHLFTTHTNANKTAPLPLSQGGPRPRRASMVGGDSHGHRGSSATRPDEVFHLAMSCVIPLAISEQNFIDDMFSLHTSLPFYEFITRPDRETLDDLNVPRPREKDPHVAKELKDAMGLIFSVLGSEMPSLIDLGLRNDKTHAVGMIVSVEHHLKDCEVSNQEFVFVVLQNMQKQLAATFARFIDDQLRAIDDTKVTAKRRIGILPFFRVFPKFVQKVDEQLGNSQTEARKLVGQGYEKIVTLMFNRLLAIGREADTSLNLTEDKDAMKEQLNAHILTIENMHYFYSALHGTDIAILGRYVEKAKASYDESMTAYIKTIVRRPLGRLIEFFEGIENLLKTGDATEVGYHLSYNRTALKKVLQQTPAEEVRRSIKLLNRRIEKHFPDYAPLRVLVWKGVYLELARDVDRYNHLIRLCYPNDNVALDFTEQDLQSWCESAARS
ncbi:hypothetical protein H4R34_002505 [Dimargaris verticillata]|uniref:Exocyst complex component Sec3 C-terminal domain-containing protein n=1 Tax=Dimargaris verticillata TaxID=2761393 RepID=A0A9W8B6E8_9FUNG|nr:hypothetical protein H4R34_002505 [Dimargaris verticillata]